MVTKEIQIEGMSCGHCVMGVKKALQKLDSIKIEEVKIGSTKISYKESEAASKKIKEAIEEAGYKVKE